MAAPPADSAWRDAIVSLALGIAEVGEAKASCDIRGLARAQDRCRAAEQLIEGLKRQLEDDEA